MDFISTSYLSAPAPVAVPESTMVTGTLDLTAIKYKLMREKNWTIERVNRVEPHYKTFLFFLGSENETMLVPSLDVDEMWHAHILDTRKYMADCASLFGRYLHHYPYLGMKDDRDKENAQRLYEKTRSQINRSLGIPDNHFSFADCGGGGCGGGCGGGGGGDGGGSGGDGGGGEHGGDHGSGHGSHNGNTDAGYVPGIIATCGGDSSRSPADDRKRRAPAPSRPGSPPRPGESPPSRPGTPKPPLWRRILGLSPIASQAWLHSVDPAFFHQEYRPSAAELETLQKRIVH